MAGKRFNAEKIERLLAPQGFTLNLPEARKNGISFIRPSSVARFYEHVLIAADNPVHAETVISAASFTSCHPSVSQRDERFRIFLSRGSEFGALTIFTAVEARAWQKTLVDNADGYCKLASNAKGPALAERLAPVFNAIDMYTRELGDIFAILDREFAFLADASRDEQREVDRLATLARRMLWLNLQDATLASLAVARFGTKVETAPDPFHNKSPHRDDGLAARLILLVDYVRKKRLEYEIAGGLHR